MKKAMTMADSAPAETGRSASVPSLDADVELVAARGRRVAALRGLVGASGRNLGDARSAA
ncbi:hypothetical protein [Streptomyces geranii]|uniref:hypothetical protein n=1 Tax=Streptomyces geranii TaxID=2058923 RepID=UPI000D0431A2|nr:hypothetical protein [Streptomyces geranii]